MAGIPQVMLYTGMSRYARRRFGDYAWHPMFIGPRGGVSFRFGEGRKFALFRWWVKRGSDQGQRSATHCSGSSQQPPMCGCFHTHRLQRQGYSIGFRYACVGSRDPLKVERGILGEADFIANVTDNTPWRGDMMEWILTGRINA